MDKAEALVRLRARKELLKGMGVGELSLFGSTARGEQGSESDVDIAVTLPMIARMTLLDFVAIQQTAADILGTPVDLIREPVRKPLLQAEIDRDRVRVF